jgi:hypothetical protein
VQLTGGLLAVPVVQVDLAEVAERGRFGGAVPECARRVRSVGMDGSGLGEVAATGKMARQCGG